MTAETRAAVDVGMMRQAIARLLPPSEDVPPGLDVPSLTEALSGYMNLLIPEVEKLAGGLPREDVPRYCALACVGEAHGKLRAQPGMGPGADVAYARKLARSLIALCDHFESLTGQVMCVACDRVIRRPDDAVPLDQVSNSGGAISARVHAACLDAPRPRR
jgi:hypothetical protein